MAWTLIANLKGPVGGKGDAGARGAQGLPGLGNVPTDPGVAGLIGTTGTSETKTALLKFMDVGYDVILLAGQSNMSGRGGPYSSNLDPVSERIFQFRSTSPANTIVAASEPLDMHDAASGIGPGLQFARKYLSTLPLNRKILLVPVAHGGTALTSTAALGWRAGVTGNLYANAVAQTLAAITAGGPGSRLTAILWVQGETDGDNNTTASQYQTDLDALIDAFRTDLATPNAPFIIGQMVPDYLMTGTRAAIDNVHSSTPRRKSRTAFVRSPYEMNNSDGNHFNAAGQRIIGPAMFAAYQQVIAGVVVNPHTLGATAGVDVRPARAYSLRRLRRSYAGAAIRVRRDVDQGQVNIGFTETGGLDSAMLLSFAQTSNVFIVTWFDQSGNERHLTQGTGASQAKIVDAGVLLTSGGKPTAAFDGVDDHYYDHIPSLYAAGSSTVSAVLKAVKPTDQKRWWAESNATLVGNQYSLLAPDAYAALQYGAPVVSTAIDNTEPTYRGSIAIFDGLIHQISAWDSGTTMAQLADGAIDNAGFSYVRSGTFSSMDRFALGGVVRAGALSGLAMSFSESIWWESKLSNTQRKAAETSQKSFYGTP